ncbi:MAG TPA: hypothetical protein VJQ77_06605, partial [Novosphingobium sp.]|nr:hypothetical protein [Novosphingobium sp.]
MGTAEALDSRGQQFRPPLAGNRSIVPDGTQSQAQLTVVRADVAASVSIDTGAQAGQVSLAGPVEGAQVVASRTSDIVGRPIDIFRPTGSGSGSNLSVRFPSRMPVAARAVTSGFGWR